jgi:hypothetical protein
MPWKTPFVSVEMICGTSFSTLDLALAAPDSFTPTLFSQPSNDDENGKRRQTEEDGTGSGGPRPTVALELSHKRHRHRRDDHRGHHGPNDRGSRPEQPSEPGEQRGHAHEQPSGAAQVAQPMRRLKHACELSRLGTVEREFSRLVPRG